MGFSLNCTPFFKIRKKSQSSAYAGPEKVRKYTEGNFKKKKESKRKENKKLQEQGRKQRKRIFLKNYIKQYNKTYLVTYIFILVSIAILHFKGVRTRKNQHLAIFIVSHYNFINWVTLSWWTYAAYGLSYWVMIQVCTTWLFHYESAICKTMRHRESACRETSPNFQGFSTLLPKDFLFFSP